MMLNRVLLSNKIVMAVAITGLLFASCRKAVDQQPETPVADDAIGTEAVTSTKTTSFTDLSSSSADLLNPGRGIEMWHNGYAVQVPTGNSTALNEYYRFAWFDFETTSNTYDWTVFDREIKGAIDGKRRLSFGVMPLFTGWGSKIGGGSLSYPQWVHNQMQADATNNKDWIYNGSWIPNWNSTYFLSAWEKLMNAIANRLNTQTYKNVKFADAIYYVDIRGYGDFGEWHTYPFQGREPTGRKATSATLKRIIDSHIKAFPNYPLVNIVGAYDGGNASRIPADVSYYALTASNTWGRLGWRRDNWGDPGTDIILSKNPYSYNGVAFKNIILDLWKYAPIVGEPLNTQSTVTGSCGSMYCDLERQVRLYHATSFGNGNYPNISSTTMRNNIVASSKATGYRIKLSNATVPAAMTRNSAFSIKTTWQNVGIAPVYENWNVVFELQNSSGTVVATSTSTMKLKLFLPSTTATTITDNFTLPSTVGAGTYKLVLKIKDPKNYSPNLKLAVTGANSDGSYTLNSAVTVS